MAKIRADLVKTREREVLQAFRQGQTVAMVNDSLHTKYGCRMGLNRIYALKALAVEIQEMTSVTL